MIFFDRQTDPTEEFSAGRRSVGQNNATVEFQNFYCQEVEEDP
jgi:hypothetical protein